MKEGFSNVNVTQDAGKLELRGLYGDVKGFFKYNLQVHFACLFTDNGLIFLRQYKTKANFTMSETTAKL